jgi:plasmid stabilization system protein ParE
MSKLRVSRDAVADLDEICLYIAQRSGVEVAQSYIENLTGTFDTIASMPSIGRDRKRTKEWHA